MGICQHRRGAPDRVRDSSVDAHRCRVLVGHRRETPIRVFVVSAILLVLIMGGIRMVWRIQRRKKHAFSRSASRTAADARGGGWRDRFPHHRPHGVEGSQHAGRSHRRHGRRSVEARPAHPWGEGGGFERQHRLAGRTLRHRADRRRHSFCHDGGEKAHLCHLHRDRLQPQDAAEHTRIARGRTRGRCLARRGGHRPAGARGNHARHAHRFELHSRQGDPRHGRRRFHRQRALPAAGESGTGAHRDFRHVRERRLHAAAGADGGIPRHRSGHRDRQRVRCGAHKRGVREVSTLLPSSTLRRTSTSP